jgi:hypothetical protein
LERSPFPGALHARFANSAKAKNHQGKLSPRRGKIPVLIPVFPEMDEMETGNLPEILYIIRE